MYEVSDNFIRNSGMYGRQLSVELSWDDISLGRDDVYKLEKKFDSDFYRSSMQQIDGEIKGRHDLEGKQINAKIGISYDNSPFEYIDYGDFYIFEHERIVGKTPEGDRTKFKAFDILIKTHVPYDVEKLNITYPITVIDLFSAIASYIGTTIINTSLVNGDKIITEDKWTNIENVTLRNVLDEIAATCGCTIIAKNNKLYGKYVDTRVEISTIPFSLTINEDTMKSLKIQSKYGGVNILNLAREGVQSEGGSGIHNNYPYPPEWNEIPPEKRVEIVIPDNQIMDKEREVYAPDLFNSISGLSYYPFEVNGNGTLHFEPMDVVKVIDLNGQELISVTTSSQLTFTTGIKEKLTSAIPGYTKEQYALVTDSKRQFMRVYLLVDQQNGQIKSLVKQVGDRGDKETTITQDLDSIEQKVSSMAVGSNIIANLNFEDDMTGWKFEGNGYLKFGERIRWFNGMTWNTNAVPIVTHSLSKNGIKFLRKGIAISPKGYVVPNEIYSYKARRVEGVQKYRIVVIEYNSDNTEIKRTPFELEAKQYEVFSIQPAQNTMYISLAFEILDDTPLVLSEQMFARGNPANYQESAEAVKIWAESQFKITAEEITSKVSVTDYNGSTITSLINQTANQVRINAEKIKLEGIVTVDGNFKVFEDGSIEVNNGVFKGTINTDKDAKVGERVEFPVLTPSSLGDLAMYTKMGKGGVLWGYDPIAVSTRAKIVYFDLINLSASVPRMLIASDGDIHISSNNLVKILAGNGNVVFDSEGLYSEGTRNIGTSTSRWGNIYLQNQPNVASDERYKSNIQDIDNDLLDAFEEVVPKLFNTKFDNNIHFGYIAQDVERALYKYCLKKYGYEFANEKVKQFAVLSKSESYLSLLYGELTVIKDAYYHREVERLKVQNQELQSELQAIKQFIGMGENNA